MYINLTKMNQKARVAILIDKMEFKANTTLIPKPDEYEEKSEVHFVYEYIFTVKNIS